MFELKFSTGNAAFDDSASAEIARILRESAARIEGGITDGKIFDVNGNSIGFFVVPVTDFEDDGE